MCEHICFWPLEEYAGRHSMNTEQDVVTAKVQAQVRSLGLTEFRRHALKCLKLKTVIKESHCSQVQALEVNTCDSSGGRLFATVAKDQATVYDDAHMADHVAVIAALALTNDAEKAKDVFYSCCWINSDGITRHPYGDALLAVAGSDPHVHIISIAEAAVVAQLPLHSSSGSIVELSAAADVPGLLLVLCKDGTMQLWQVATGHCYLSIKSDAFSAVLHPCGECIITSSRTGKLSKWDLRQVISAETPLTAPGHAVNDMAAAAAGAAGVVKEPLLLPSVHDGSVVDCMRFLAGDQLATKTSDGHMRVFNMPNGGLISSWRVPGCSNATASYSSRCSFGHTQDGQYIAVGNHNATAYVYETSTGLQVARVGAIRVQGSVRACGLSEDCRHLLMVVGSGYVFRFESRPAAADSEEEDAPESENEDVVMRDGSTPPPGLQAQAQPPQHQQQQVQQLGRHQAQHQSAHQATDGLGQQQQQLPGSGSMSYGLQPGHSPMAEQDTTLGMLEGTSGLLAGNTPDAVMNSDWGGPQGGLAAGWMHEGGDAGACMMAASATPGLNQAHDGHVSSQQKKPRLDGARVVDASPLVFRPTPEKR